MNDTLASLLIHLSLLIRNLTIELRDNDKTIDVWQAEMLRLLAQYLALATMKGRGKNRLSVEEEQRVANALREQAGYLNHFVQEIRATGWQDKYLDRARLYAESIRQPFWRATTDCLHLPIVPSSPLLDCGQFCKCYLSIEWVDKADCSANIYWVTTNSEVSPDCVRLSQEWNPLQVRQGIIINA